MTQCKTVLFVCPNADGHINALLGIADKLKDCFGYRIVFLVLGAIGGKGVQRHGHELIQASSAKNNSGKKTSLANAVQGLREQFMKADPVESLIQVLGEMLEVIGEDLVTNYDSYVQTIKDVKADLIVADFSVLLPWLIKQKQVPWVRVYSANPMELTEPTRPDGIRPPIMIGTSLLKNKETRRRFREEKPFEWQRMLNFWKRENERIVNATFDVPRLDRFFEKHGMKPIGLLNREYDSTYLNIYLYPKELDYDQEDDLLAYPARVFRCDHLVRKHTAKAELWSERLEKAMKGKSALVYFSLGTLASGDTDLVQRYLDMFKSDHDRLYVVSKGANGHCINSDAPNMIGENYVPQTVILQKADLAIIHGGNNSLTECLYYGVPMLVLPVFADQLDNAQRVSDLDLGKRLNIFESTKEQVMEAIDDILKDKVLKEEINNISQKIQARDDISKLALLLNKLISDGKLDEEFLNGYKDNCIKSKVELLI